MSHFIEQNASFWSVKWLILKIATKIPAILNAFFSVSEAFVFLKRSKIPAKIFG